MEEPKKEEAAEVETINLRVVSQEGEEILFRIKKQTPLKRLMEAYCNRTAKSMNSMRFLYDGQRIAADQTPVDLKMQDRDIIDAVLQQVGGKEF